MVALGRWQDINTRLRDRFGYFNYCRLDHREQGLILFLSLSTGHVLATHGREPPGSTYEDANSGDLATFEDANTNLGFRVGLVFFSESDGNKVVILIDTSD